MKISTDMLLDIIAEASIRVHRDITFAYKAGKLDEYLEKMGMQDLLPQESPLTWNDALPEGKIVIFGALHQFV